MRIRPVLLLLIILLLPFAGVGAQSGGTIEYGETVSASITNEEPVQQWTFEGEQGDQITITMTATDPANGTLDGTLTLSGAGVILAENDDAESGITLDPAIENVVLPADGTYAIEATRYGRETGTSTGDYDLTLTLIAQGVEPTAEPTTAPATATPPPVSGGDTLTYNSPVSGTLDRQNPEDRYTFTGTAGDVISIRMTKTDDNSDLDPYLQLFDADENLLIENDDESGTTRDAGIVNFSLPADGTYTVVATRYGFGTGTSSGDYALVIESDDAPVAPSPTPEGTPATSETATPPPVSPDGENLAYGQTINGTLNGGEAVYTFSGQAGDVVTISVKRAATSELDPALALRDANGNTVSENQQFNGIADARISAFALPAAGSYNIVISGERGTTGNFILYVFSDNASTASDPAAQPTPATTPTAQPTPEPTAEPTEEVPVVENTLDLSNATLAITLAWEGTTDFDFAVTDPDGNIIDLFSTADEGGIFGGDANGGCSERAAEPSETVYWETEPPAGTYTLEVINVLPCEDRGAQPYTITITVDGEVVETLEGELGEGSATTHEWTLE